MLELLWWGVAISNMLYDVFSNIIGNNTMTLFQTLSEGKPQCDKNLTLIYYVVWIKRDERSEKC